MIDRVPIAGARQRRRIVDKLGGLLGTAMLSRRRLLLAIALSPFAGPAAAQGYSRPAAQVIARAFAATGGSGWYQLRGWHETGKRGGVAYESWIDPVRYGMRIETREANGRLQIQGFNGQAVWQVASTGAITAVNDHPTLAQARTEAFFAAGGYFFQGRFGARGDYLGVHNLHGRAYEVVRVEPWNGDPRELWFDARTHLLARIVDHGGRKAAAVQVSDYRRVGPVLVAFRFTPEPGAAPDGIARQVATLTFTPADRDAFSLDRPAALAKVQASAAEAP
jgi:hypothetical protein